MSWIFLEADDVWCFRDNTPKLTGGSVVIQSVFPPMPSTIQGSLRSLILGKSGVGWRAFREQSTPAAQRLGQIIGHPATAGQTPSLGAFSMAGPLLARREDGRVMPYLPIANDVRKVKGRQGGFVNLAPSMKRRFSSNWPKDGLFPLWHSGNEEVEALNITYWLNTRNLNAYLTGKPFSGSRSEALYQREPRLGIELNYNIRQAAESMLYQVEFIRPAAGVGLLAWVNDNVASAFAPQGSMRIGGEGRNAYYQILDMDEVEPVPQVPADKQQGRLKLVFLTPAYFDGGWQPQDGDAGWSTLLGTSVRLIAASIGRPHRCGGWDIAARNGRGWHKPIVSYVPASSVYYFEVASDGVELPPFHAITQTPDSDPLPLDRLGYGQVTVGTWNWR